MYTTKHYRKPAPLVCGILVNPVDVDVQASSPDHFGLSRQVRYCCGEFGLTWASEAQYWRRLCMHSLLWVCLTATETTNRT